MTTFAPPPAANGADPGLAGAQSYGRVSGAADDVDRAALDRVLLRVRLLARRRLLWLERLYGLDSGDIRGREIGRLLDDADDPAMERAWSNEALGDLNAEIEGVTEALAADQDSRLARLRRLLALDPLDVDILHVCLAAAVDPSLGRLFAYLQDDSTRAAPTPQMIARLCGYGRFLTWENDSALRRWRLVREATAGAIAVGAENDQLMPLSLDPVVRDWLSGAEPIDPLLLECASLVRVQPPLPEWDVDDAVSFAARSLEADPATTVVLHIVAPPRSGRRTFAAAVAFELGMPLLAVDSSRIEDADWTETFVAAQRHAFLNRCALLWNTGEADRHPLMASRGARPWPTHIAHFPLQFVLHDDLRSRAGAGGEGIDLPASAPNIPGAVELTVTLAPLAYQTRLRLWMQAVPHAAASQPELIAKLAARRSARVGDIAAAARIPAAYPRSIAALTESLNAAQRDLLGRLAQPLSCPFTWDDLIVHPALGDSLRDFVFEAEDRAAFWDEPEARRLFPQGRGLVALFSGPPGTGKTMAAQVIAAQLGLDLYRIDLSTIVSKYVGETSHNLQRVLSRAANMDVILLFDEADALFARRTDVKDAHDRFANTDTNHLLQAIESYSGLAILASNRKAGIDTAFVRRLRYVLDFPKPDAGQRLTLWTRLIEALAGDEAVRRLHRLLVRVAEELDLTGAQIKYAVLSAIFAARRDGRPLASEHLVRGLERELSKEGRLLSENERARWFRHD
ncbi:MAG: ATP-binding protein [Chloroflexi bacterium]|nr:ATP-binding protein [Chloroflexota bacterium]